MIEFQAEKYWNYQLTVAGAPGASIDPELAEGQLLYIMGDSYYSMVSDFLGKVQGWTETQAISWLAHGLTKLSPLRNTTDDLPKIVSNGSTSDINLCYPRVDMSFQRAAWVGNGTSFNNSGDTGLLAENSAAELMIGEASADEHRVINKFFQQNAAASTVRLLDIAQGWTEATGRAANPGSGVLTLTSTNYAAMGSSNITVNNTTGSGTTTKTLAQWAGTNMWTSVSNALNPSVNPTTAPYTTVLMTPGPQTAPAGQSGQAYTGVGAFINGVGGFAALISDNMVISNGGDGGGLAQELYVTDPASSSVYYSVLQITQDGQPTILFTQTATANQQITITESVPAVSVPVITAEIDSGTVTISGGLVNLYNSFNTAVNQLPASDVATTGSATGAIGLQYTNLGFVGGASNFLPTAGASGGVVASIGNWVYDPVNIVTGEFYINAIDLRLNGPMPLEIGRTYGSLNPAENNFGYGWKMNYFPYLVLSGDSASSGTTVSTMPSVIWAAEMDGSVIAYRRKTSPNSRWVPTAADNPNLVNVANGAMGGATNRFNNRIDVATVNGVTVFTLTACDGSVRTFPVRSFPGGTGVTKTRPYLQTWADSQGNSYTFSFGIASTSTDYGQVNKIQSTNGDYVGFVYDIYGHVIEAYSGDGRFLYYQYDSFGDLTQVTLPDASTISYSYQHSTTAATGTTVATPYSLHLITQETKPNGRILQNTFDAKSRVLTQLATVGTTQTPIQNATFTYGAQTQNADGVTFDGTNTVTDVFGRTTTYIYTGNEISQVNYPPQNYETTGKTATQTWFQPSNSGAAGYYQRSLQSTTDKRNLTSSYQYDANGNLLTLTAVGNLTGGVSTAETATTTMTYNSATSVLLPGSGVSTVPNTLASVTDAVGHRSVYTYDPLHPFEISRIDKYANAIGGGGGTLISSDVMQYTDTLSGSTSAFGLLQQAIVAVGTSDQATVRYTYNGNGFPASKTQFTGTEDPNVVTNYTYDLRGEMTSETDAAGRSTQYAYDAMGHRIGVERYDEWSNLVGWNYDYYNQNGDIEWKQGSRYNPVDYVTMLYDGAGRLSQEVKWLSGALADGSGVTGTGYATTNYLHDAFGNLTEMDDPNGNVATMTYDAIGEMLTRTVQSGTGPVTESFLYEPGGQVSSHTTVLSGTETRAYTYRGQLMSDAMPDGTTGSRLYDLVGRVVQETLTNGSYWKTVYNDASLNVTRTFFNASGTALGSQSQTFDRRGNVISTTDLAGNIFATAYDGLNRVKTFTGPPAANPSGLGSTAQQTVSHQYDAAGVMHIVQNAAGESTYSFMDALGRPTLKSVYNSDSSVASNTGYWYSPDHQSVVATLGTGTNAITTTSYTDTRGLPVLVKHADGTFAGMAYDANGNKIIQVDEQNALTSWTYDPLNHLATETLPASTSANAAVITFTYNAAGELLTRQMPEGLTAKRVYDTAGRKVSEELDDAGGAVTRNFTYGYYGSGPDFGLLQTLTDPRGLTFTTTYDDWLHVATVNSAGSSTPQQNQNTTFGYDIRGMVSSIAQSYAVGSTGPPTLVTRNYDAYGQMNQEIVSVDGTVTSEWNQSWNNAGRRSALNFQLAAQGTGAGNQYGFSYNGSGLLTGVVNSGANYSFSYGDNSLLQQRTTPLWTQAITQRDAQGRISAENVTGNGITLLSESMTFHGDSRLGTYGVTGAMAATESRTYDYDVRGRLKTEPYQLNNTQSGQLTGSQSATYLFDQSPLGGPGSEGGLGVRTIQAVTDSVGSEVTHQTSFLQADQDYVAPQNGVSATLSWQYDAAGYAFTRGVVGGQTQTMTWDAWGRLVTVSNRDSNSDGSDFTTVYDGLGRRVQSSFQNIASGSASGAAVPLTYFYDPQVEFLELGYSDSGTRTWRVYGPDLNGIYGGLQGTGGLAAIVDETTGNTNGSINDKFGNSLGLNGSSSYLSHGSALGGYGVLPGSQLDYSIDLDPQWRGHYVDWTGLYYMGARYYDPQSGRFLSPDPLGHGADMSLYAYCNGDPVNGLDPDGRLGKGQFEDEAQSLLYTGPNYGTGEVRTGWSGGSAFENFASQQGMGFFDKAQTLGLGAAMTSLIENTGDSLNQVLGAMVPFYRTGFELATRRSFDNPNNSVDVNDAVEGFEVELLTTVLMAGGASGEIMSEAAMAARGEIVAAEEAGSFIGGCFPSGTIVSTENGAEEIQNIEIGEKVWSYNVKAKKWELKPVEAAFIHDYAGDVVDFEVNGNPVEASGNHPVWVVSGEDLESRPDAKDVPLNERQSRPDGRWVEARALRNGDILLLRGGTHGAVDQFASRSDRLPGVQYPCSG